MKAFLLLLGVTFVFLRHVVDTAFAQVGPKSWNTGGRQKHPNLRIAKKTYFWRIYVVVLSFFFLQCVDGRCDLIGGLGIKKFEKTPDRVPSQRENNSQSTPQQLSPQEQQQIQQEAAARAAAEERRRAEEERREAIRLAAVRDKQQGLTAINEKNWQMAIDRLTSALTGFPNDVEIKTKLSLAKDKLAQEKERRRRNEEAFNPYAKVTPNAGVDLPVRVERQISNINPSSPYGPPSLQLPTQPIKQKRSATAQPTIDLWQQDVPAEQRASRTVILEEKYVGNPNLPSAALNDGKKGYGIPGLPGIYTGGPGSGSGLTPQNEPKLKTEIGDSINANPVSSPNLPSISLNGGKQGYGIPGLPGVYTGGPGSGSGITPPNESKLKTEIGDSISAEQVGNANLPSVALGNSKQGYGIPGLPGVHTGGPSPDSSVTPPGRPGVKVKAEPSGAAVPSPPRTLTPQTAAQPIAVLQQQANASQAAAAAPVLEDTSFKGQAGFDTPLPRATQPAMTTVSGRTGTAVSSTKGIEQLASTAKGGQNSEKNFDTSGKYSGSLNTSGGAKTTSPDLSVADSPGKQGIVNPSVLKVNSSNPISPAQSAFNATGTPADADHWEQVRLDLDKNGRDAPANKRKLPKFPPLRVGEKIPKKWLDHFKDEGLRNWAATMVLGKVLLSYDRFGIAVQNGRVVIFEEVFNNLPAEEQINLLAFELGKAFYSKYFPRKEPFNILDAKARPYFDVSPQTMKLGDTDADSDFGYIFRVEILGISTDGESLKDFQGNQTIPLLRGPDTGLVAPRGWAATHQAFRDKVNPILISGGFLRIR